MNAFRSRPKSAFPFTRSRTERGSILLLALFMLFVLFMLATAFMSLLPTEIASAAQEGAWISGTYAADAGLSDAVARVEDQLARGLSPEAGQNVVTGSINGWDYSVSVEDDTSATQGLRAWSMVSTASMRGQTHAIIRVKMVQDSFARYAAYSDLNSPGGRNAPVWLADAVVSGPIHSNSQMYIGIPDGLYGDESQGPGKGHGHGGWTPSDLPTEAPFQGSITQAVPGYRPNARADGIIYTDGSLHKDDTRAPWYPQDPAASAARYDRLFSQGRDSVTSGVKPIDMPSDVESIRRGA